DGHGQQRTRHLLARGQQHVHFPAGRRVADLMGQGDQLVGGVAHGRYHRHHVVAGPFRGDDAPRYRFNPLGRRHRRPSVFLHQQVHSVASPSTTAPSRSGFSASQWAPMPASRNAVTMAMPMGSARLPAGMNATTDGPAPLSAAPSAPSRRAARTTSAKPGTKASLYGWCSRPASAAARTDTSPAAMAAVNKLARPTLKAASAWGTMAGNA